MNKETKLQTNGELMNGRRLSGPRLERLLAQRQWTVAQFTRAIRSRGLPWFKATDALIHSYIKGETDPSLSKFFLMAEILGFTPFEAIRELTEDVGVN